MAFRLTGLTFLVALGAGLYFYDYPRVAAELPEAVLAYLVAAYPAIPRKPYPRPNPKLVPPGLRAD